MKKRFFAMVLTLILTLGVTVTAIAEEKKDIDFSQYTDEELLDLEALIKSELDGRGLTNKKVNRLPTGTYKVGSEIPEGAYLFRRIPGDDHAAVIFVSDSEDATMYSDGGSLKDKKDCVLRLKEGQIVEIMITGVLASKFTTDTMEWE